MVRSLTPVIAFAVAVSAAAAPVPKAVKKAPATPDGTWELTEFHSNGVKQNHSGMTKVWCLEGETFYVGPKEARNAWGLKVVDPATPTRRRTVPPNGGTGYSSMVEVDGDELRYCYAGDPKAAVTECEPAANVFYYVFKRVKPDDK